MLTKRIIACLDVDAGRVVKGVQFSSLRDAGDPAELALTHGRAGADEVVLLDISATYEHRSTLLDVVRRTARQLFIPFTVGGGIRSLDDAAAVFDAGADKVTVNSAALADPALISRIAHRYGSQAVIVAIDALRVSNGNGMSFGVKGTGGRQSTGRNAVEWAAEAERHGAGEIMLTSIDRDGTARRLRLRPDSGGGQRSQHSGDCVGRRGAAGTLHRRLPRRACRRRPGRVHFSSGHDSDW